MIVVSAGALVSRKCCVNFFAVPFCRAGGHALEFINRYLHILMVLPSHWRLDL